MTKYDEVVSHLEALLQDGKAILLGLVCLNGDTEKIPMVSRLMERSKHHEGSWNAVH